MLIAKKTLNKTDVMITNIISLLMMTSFSPCGPRTNA